MAPMRWNRVARGVAAGALAVWLLFFVWYQLVYVLWHHWPVSVEVDLWFLMVWVLPMAVGVALWPTYKASRPVADVSHDPDALAAWEDDDDCSEDGALLSGSMKTQAGSVDSDRGSSIGDRWWAQKWRWFGYTWSVAEVAMMLVAVGTATVSFAMWAWRFYVRYEPDRPLSVAMVFKLVGDAMALPPLWTMATALLLMGRHAVWLDAVGLHYERAVMMHRWLGFVLLAETTIHVVGYMVFYAMEGTLVVSSIPGPGRHLAYANFPGYIGFVALLVLSLMSIPYVRRRWFEAFSWTHLLYTVYIVGTIYHYRPTALWLLPPSALFMADRFARTKLVRALCTPLVLVGGVRSNENTVCLLFSLDAKSQLERIPRYTALQYVYLRVPSISSWQWHPFTISSSWDHDGKLMTIHIKALGDWSRSLVSLFPKKEQPDFAHIAETTMPLQPLPVVDVWGPFGDDSDSFLENKATIVVAGGVGVTAAMALLTRLMERRGACAQLPSRPHVRFIWMVQHRTELEAYAPFLRKLMRWQQPQYQFQYSVHATRDTAPMNVDSPSCALSEDSTASSAAAGELPTLDGDRRAHDNQEHLRSTARPLRLQHLLVLAMLATAVVGYYAARRLTLGPIDAYTDSHCLPDWSQAGPACILVRYGVRQMILYALPLLLMYIIGWALVLAIHWKFSRRQPFALPVVHVDRFGGGHASASPNTFAGTEDSVNPSVNVTEGRPDLQSQLETWAAGLPKGREFRSCP